MVIFNIGLIHGSIVIPAQATVQLASNITVVQHVILQKT